MDGRCRLVNETWRAADYSDSICHAEYQILVAVRIELSFEVLFAV